MIGVDRIDDVRRLGRSGASVASIARDTGVSEPTVRECLREPDLSERPPVVGRAPGVAPARAVRGAGGLVAARGQAPLVQTAPHREEGVRQADGEGLRRLLRHGPAVREEERGGLAAELDAREAQGFPPLNWLAGECQVDFGQADFRVCGVVARGLALAHSLVRTARVCPCGMGPRGVLLGC